MDSLTRLIETETAGWSPQQRAALAERLDRDVSRRLCNEHYPTAGALAQRCDPGTRQTPALERIDAEIEWALSTPDARLLITVGPQEGKSTRVAVWGAVRSLVQNPDRRVVLASYSETLARSHSRKVRNLILEHGHGATDPVSGMALPDKLGLALAPDSWAASRWQIAGHKGGMFAVGVGGSLTGQPAEVGIIDDAHRNMEDADSAAAREKVIDWWQSVFQTRLAPGAPVIIIMTRWNELDIAGHLLREDRKLPESERQWRWVNFPAIAEPGIPDALGREPGTPLTSARGRTLKDFERTRRDVGERTWSALYQGMPTPTTGGLFSRAWFNDHRAPQLDQQPVTTVVGVDPAETGEHDEAGITAAALLADGRIALTHDQSGHMTSDQWATAAIRLAAQVRAHAIVYEAYSAGTTYKKVLEDAWAAEHKRCALQPSDDQTLGDATIRWIKAHPTPPFLIKPWRGKGDAVARSAMLRRDVETGQCFVVGAAMAVMESQAVAWQSGQHQPDRVAAAIIAHHEAKELGTGGGVAAPGAPSRTVPPAGWMTARLG
ncbi:terminase large subunit domain-containing protein [Tomitella gaofuii]|uniref:terminase large subunit domain-containing protein n=1 Tax=Tomitella gaofuii TaxID=2760083 RepID=UPI0015FAF397|nr:terminase family protein [Tomitella gaofuii]